MNKPKTIDMGETHFTHAELVEYDDPNASKYPDGLTIHTVQCCDCGAYTNDGEVNNIVHHATCTPGESDKWEKHYSTCYQCGKEVKWLADDCRCKDCTRMTPEEMV